MTDGSGRKLIKVHGRIFAVFILIQGQATSASPQFLATWAPAHESVADEPAPDEPALDKTITLTEALTYATTRNFLSRSQYGRVVEARLRVNLAISSLIPNLNISTALAFATQSYPQAVIGTVGFLYPSNWLSWRESKLFFEAQRRGFAVALADQSVSVEVIFYELNMLRCSLAVYERYIRKTELLIELASRTIADPLALEQPLDETKNLLIKLTIDRDQIARTLAQIRPEFFRALGADPGRWHRLEVESFVPPVIAGHRTLTGEHFYPKVVARSQELAQFRFLVEAAHLGMYARVFEFIFPFFSRDANVGFGYPSHVKLGRSQIRGLLVRKDEAQADLRLHLEQAVGDFNWAVITNVKYRGQWQNGRHLLSYLKGRLREEHLFDDNGVDALSFMVAGELGRVRTAHTALQAQARLRRLLWRGEQYKAILAIAAEKKPEKNLGLLRLFENSRIERALRHHRLDGLLADLRS